MFEDPALNQPIKSLQIMLEAIAYTFSTIPIVNPDGIFGSSTEDSVKAFQKEYGLPVTGAADEETFRSIVAVYETAMELLSPARGPMYHFPAALTVSQGQFHPTVYLVQAMLNAIHDEFPEIPAPAVTGRMDRNTATAIKKLQALSGMKETGILNKPTYDRISLIYRILFDRTLLPSQG